MNLDDLWGGIIESLAVEPSSHLVQLVVRVVTAGEVVMHQLGFEGVRELRLFDEVGEPWDYTELTSVRCTRQPDRTITTDLVLWSEAAGLVIRSDIVRINGEELLL